MLEMGEYLCSSKCTYVRGESIVRRSKFCVMHCVCCFAVVGVLAGDA
jgi:hypothetical protein